MLKFSKTIDSETKQVLICDNTQISHFKQYGFTEQEVEQAYDGQWYLKGFAPAEPEKSYAEKRSAEYPPIPEQLDMIYWDKLNNTSLWQNKITEIKTKYPKS